MIRDRIKSLRRVRAGDLLPHPKNWRRHPEGQRRAVQAALAEIGFADALLARETPEGLMLIDGHLRADLDSDQKVPVLVLNVDEQEAEKLLATLDPLAGLAETDLEAIGALAGSLDFEHPDLEAVVAELLGNEGAIDVIEDTPPDPPDEPVTQPGDMYVLGDPRKGHRLLCGDSASEQDLDRLLDSAAIHLVNTDPPYNVKVEPASGGAWTGQRPPSWRNTAAKRRSGELPAKRKLAKQKSSAKSRRLVNDFKTDAEFKECLDRWISNFHRVLVPGGTYYLWGGFSNLFDYPPVIQAHDLHFAQAIIWVKGHPVITRKDFMCNHEWCFYGWKKGAAHRFFGQTNEVDVWHVKKIAPVKMVHLTEKPVELAVRAM